MDHQTDGDDRAGEPHHPFIDRLKEAAIEAEIETGYHEETPQEVRDSLIARALKAALGFVIIAIGIAALPLPGPGWLIIVFGLSLLPFAWAERTVLLIRRKVPGVPEHGTIPLRTWVIMGTLVAAALTISLFWGDTVTAWSGEMWDSVF